MKPFADIYEVAHNENFTLRRVPYFSHFTCHGAAMPREKCWVIAPAEARL